MDIKKKTDQMESVKMTSNKCIKYTLIMNMNDP